MKFVFATESFRLNGVPCAGFPLILDDAMRIVEPAHHFLIHTCIRSGRIASQHSWERYGRDLYDFFGFILGTGLD